MTAPPTNAPSAFIKNAASLKLDISGTLYAEVELPSAFIKNAASLKRGMILVEVLACIAPSAFIKNAASLKHGEAILGGKPIRTFRVHQERGLIEANAAFSFLTEFAKPSAFIKNAASLKRTYATRVLTANTNLPRSSRTRPH